ncbi:hypothetical protein BH10PLA2_BH10PLA2_10910 [soil metagenome]
MKIQIIKRPAAYHNIEEIVSYLRKTAGSTRARRFLDQVQVTLDQIAEQPLSGTLWDSPKPGLQNLRVRVIPGFRNYVLFYIPGDRSVELLHILHGARDIAAIFED